MFPGSCCVGLAVWGCCVGLAGQAPLCLLTQLPAGGLCATWETLSGFRATPPHHPPTAPCSQLRLQPLGNAANHRSCKQLLPPLPPPFYSSLSTFFFFFSAFACVYSTRLILCFLNL